ncbi:MAG: aminotransferase class IV [Phycisphaerales bacterium]|nr:aminotransferase class IV [Phycisphaerales bacterium]
MNDIPPAIIRNGDLVQLSDNPISPLNLSFQYGYGFFDTLRIYQRQAEFINDHIERNNQTLNLMGLTPNIPLTVTLFEDSLQKLLHLQKDSSQLFKCKIIFYLNDSLLSLNHTLLCDWIIFLQYFDNVLTSQQDKGMTLGVYDKIEKNYNILSPCKTNNYLPNILAKKRAQEACVDDMLFLNYKGQVVESTIANVWIVKKGVLYTPPITDGPIGGIMRKHILYHAPILGYLVEEQSLVLEDLHQADEIFLSNSIRKIIWVKQLNNFFFKKGNITNTLIKHFENYESINLAL